MKFQNSINFARKSLFGILTAAYLSTAAGMIKTTIQNDRRENISYYSWNHSPIFQFPLTDEEKREMIISNSEAVDLYLDCDHKRHNGYLIQEEIREKVRRRRYLEDLWTRDFNEQASMAPFVMRYIDTTQKWYDLLNGNGWFRNNFNDWREGGRIHKAIDVFAPVNSYIYSPFSGRVIASADNWEGKWSRKRRLYDVKRGLGEWSGNGVILFNPLDRSYLFIMHMKEVYVGNGDIVSRGQIIGTVGKTGNALSPRVMSHVHTDYKISGISCLVIQNAFWKLMETRTTLLAQRNGNGKNSGIDE